MKKNDKLVVLLGVIVLITASVGIYYYEYSEVSTTKANVEDIFDITGKLVNEPDAITLADNCAYYPLIATPLAVHYDGEGGQHLKPLYVENFDEPSSAITSVRDQIGIFSNTEIFDGSMDAKNYSLYIAKKYWDKSKAALIIKYDEEGYNLGVAATPIASYLSIPVIVTDKLDQDVKEVLQDLGVKYSLICGDIEDYENTLKFKDINEILNASIELVTHKFGDVEYITLTNPMDVQLPEVLDREILISERGEIKSAVLFPSNLLNVAQALAQQPKFTFTIPDYKYARVILDVKNLVDPKYVEEFGDNIIVGGSLTGYIRTTAYPLNVDSNGNALEDRLHFETIMYDMGGEEFQISLTAQFHVLDSAEYEITVTVEEISDPYYPTMKQFSSIAPYLTAYHKGIIYAEPDFAFALTDDVEYNGEMLNGNTQVMYNPMLIPVINQHVYENIHVPLNDILAKIKDVESIEYLKEKCDSDPLCIALVGDTVMLPQYYYRSPHNDPFEKPVSGCYATNCPSDFIYGNIDPEIYSLLPYDSDHLENDLHSEYPEVENIVGRITGWDVQDACALIDRTLFYDEIIDDFGEWKDNAAVLVGAGTEVQRIPIINTIQKILGHNDPMKFPSGEKYFLIKRIVSNFEQGGFNAQSAEKSMAQRVGFSTEALREIKTNGLLNRLLFPWMRIKFRQGLGSIDELKDPEWWIETILGDSSDQVIGGQLEQNSNLIISDSHAIFFEKEHGDSLLNTMGGPFYEIFSRFIPMGIRTSLECLGAYTVRDVPYMEMGPSVMLVEGCGSGKIDGLIPENFLGNAYLHAGVNAYISPTTFSAFYGALEPRPDFNGGVGLGIAGFMKAWSDWKLKGEFPDLCFNQFMWEHMVLNMAKNDVSVGQALKEAKNVFLPETFWDEFRWKPVLNLPSNIPDYLLEQIKEASSAESGGDHHPVEKYCTVYQLNLLGDPAFNPYEPGNEGSK